MCGCYRAGNKAALLERLSTPPPPLKENRESRDLLYGAQSRQEQVQEQEAGAGDVALWSIWESNQNGGTLSPRVFPPSCFQREACCTPPCGTPPVFSSIPHPCCCALRLDRGGGVCVLGKGRGNIKRGCEQGRRPPSRPRRALARQGCALPNRGKREEENEDLGLLLSSSAPIPLSELVRRGHATARMRRRSNEMLEEEEEQAQGKRVCG